MRFRFSQEDSNELRTLLAIQDPDRERSRRRRDFAVAFNVLILATLACAAVLVHHLFFAGSAPGAG